VHTSDTTRAATHTHSLTHTCARSHGAGQRHELVVPITIGAAASVCATLRRIAVCARSHCRLLHVGCRARPCTPQARGANHDRRGRGAGAAHATQAWPRAGVAQGRRGPGQAQRHRLVRSDAFGTRGYHSTTAGTDTTRVPARVLAGSAFARVRRGRFARSALRRVRRTTAGCIVEMGYACDGLPRGFGLARGAYGTMKRTTSLRPCSNRCSPKP
jgi:hypothetical protein